eukprot:COSAG06_NODE_35_length_30757_cov_53.112532_17_plen_241_part_00
MATHDPLSTAGLALLLQLQSHAQVHTLLGVQWDHHLVPWALPRHYALEPQLEVDGRVGVLDRGVEAGDRVVLVAAVGLPHQLAELVGHRRLDLGGEVQVVDGVVAAGDPIEGAKQHGGVRRQEQLQVEALDAPVLREWDRVLPEQQATGQRDGELGATSQRHLVGVHLCHHNLVGSKVGGGEAGHAHVTHQVLWRGANGQVGREHRVVVLDVLDGLRGLRGAETRPSWQARTGMTSRKAT